MTLSGRLCERTRRRDCVKLESMNAEGTWYEGKWNDWRWRTPDHWSFKLDGCGTRNDILLGRTRDRHSAIRPVDTTSTVPRQYGDGRGEVIPSFDGTDFRRHERRGLLFCVQYTSDPTQREGLESFWSDSKDMRSICVKKSRTWKHRMVLRSCLIT